MSQISRERIRALREFEAARFAELRPRGTGLLERAKASMPNGVPVAWMATLYEHPSIVVQRGSGGSFVDVDENTYLDFNLADTSMFTGYGVEPVVRAVSERVAAGPQFLLPTEDAEKVSLELARRFGLSFWQFTLSSTQANTPCPLACVRVTSSSVEIQPGPPDAPTSKGEFDVHERSGGWLVDAYRMRQRRDD